MGKSGVFFMEPDPWYNSTGGNIKAFKPGIVHAEGAISTDDFVASSLATKAGGADTDVAFSDMFNAVRQQTNTVGRPVNGIIAKPNTHAFVQVLGPDGSVIQCFNNIGINMSTSQSGYYLQDRELGKREDFDPFAGIKGTFSAMGDAMGFGGGGEESKPGLHPGDDDANMADIWTDWILQSAQESRIEKTQVVETFGDSYFYAFGQRPRSIQFSGLLMNTTDYNWRAIFWKNWDEFFRATKLVERGARLYIQWDDIIVEGYPINAVCSEVADSPNAMKFNFQLFVTRYINVSAQSGFLTQRYMRIAQLRAGSGLGMVDKNNGYRLMGGEAFDPRSFNYIKPKAPGSFFGPWGGGLLGVEGALGLRTGSGAQYQKFSLLGQLGPQAGNTAKRALLSVPVVGDVARGLAETTNIGAAIVRNLGYAANAMQKMKILNGRDAALHSAFVQDFNRKMTRDLLGSLAQDVSDLAEDLLGVRRGEIDQMLGYFTDVTDSLRDETREGRKFQLSKSAKFSSVQRAAREIYNPDIYSDQKGTGEQPGGIVLIDGGGNNINEVVMSFTPGAPSEEP